MNFRYDALHAFQPLAFDIDPIAAPRAAHGGGVGA